MVAVALEEREAGGEGRRVHNGENRPRELAGRGMKERDTQMELC